MAAAEARKALKYWANQLRSVVELDDAIDEAGSLEGLVKHQKALLTTLKQQESDIRKDIAAAQGEYKAKTDVAEADRLQAQSELSRARASAVAIVDEARRDGENRIDGARRQAEQILTDAKADAMADKERAGAELAEIRRAIVSEKVNLDTLTKAAAEAKQRLDAANHEIDAIAERYRKR